MSKDLQSLSGKQEKVVVGLMSGTSKDGIDAALVKLVGFGLSTKIDLIHFISLPYKKEIKAKLDKLTKECSLKDISDLNFIIGDEFSEAAQKVISESGLSFNDVDLIGSHGQTVYHNPPSYKAG
ncbi:MAG: anhydro-N-acetylmuramic acid kinase, partial [Thermodesulfobacteriota bacterium]